MVSVGARRAAAHNKTAPNGAVLLLSLLDSRHPTREISAFRGGQAGDGIFARTIKSRVI